MGTFSKVTYAITVVIAAGTLFGLGYWRGLSQQNTAVAACEQREEMERKNRWDLEDMLADAYRTINDNATLNSRCREIVFLDEVFNVPHR